MARSPAEVESFIPLKKTEFYILLALADGERHGYGLMQEIQRMTDGQSKVGPGSLYGTIKRMLADGLVEESDHRPDPEVDDQRRRYYRLTELGQLVASAEAVRLHRLVDVARRKELLGNA